MYTELFVERVGWYLKNRCSENLGYLTIFWKFLLRSGEDMGAARKAIIQKIEETYSTKIEGDSRTSNYIWLAEPAIWLGQFFGADFLHLVRPKLLEGLIINFHELMSGLMHASTSRINIVVDELIELARIAEYDISVQLQDFLSTCRKLAAGHADLKLEKVERLIGDYSPFAGDEPFGQRFTLRGSIAHKREELSKQNYTRGIIEGLDKYLASLPGNIS